MIAGSLLTENSKIVHCYIPGKLTILTSDDEVWAKHRSWYFDTCRSKIHNMDLEGVEISVPIKSWKCSAHHTLRSWCSLGW